MTDSTSRRHLRESSTVKFISDELFQPTIGVKRFQPSSPASMTTAVAFSGRSRIDLGDEMELKESDASMTDNHTGRSHAADMMEMDVEEETKEPDIKRRKSLTESFDATSSACPNCKQQLTVDQLAVLPCGHAICRPCGKKRFNGLKRSIDCSTCPMDAEIDPAEMLLNQLPTLQSSVAHSSSESSTSEKRSVCFEPGCAQVATHFCKGDENGKGSCGPLCDKHTSSNHQRKKSHQLVSFAEIEQEKEAERKAIELKAATKRKGQIQPHLEKIQELKLKFAQGSELHHMLQLKEEDCLQVFASQLQSLTEFRRQIKEWIKDATLVRDYYTISLQRDSQLFDKLINKIADMEHTLTNFTTPQINSSMKKLIQEAEDLEAVVSYAPKWPTHPAITIKEDLKAAKLLASLAPNLYEKLASFLRESGKSLANRQLLYKADWHGWYRNAFIRECQGKTDTLILVEVLVPVEDHPPRRYLFGAYIAPTLIDLSVITDKDCRSFLFSLENGVNTPVRFSLVRTHPEPAQAADLRHGIGIGVEGVQNKTQNFNFILYFNDRQGNDPSGNSANEYNSKSAYQLDNDSKLSLGGNEFDMEALAGDEFFGANQIEAYQLL